MKGTIIQPQDFQFAVVSGYPCAIGFDDSDGELGIQLKLLLTTPDGKVHIPITRDGINDTIELMWVKRYPRSSATDTTAEKMFFLDWLNECNAKIKEYFPDASSPDDGGDSDTQYPGSMGVLEGFLKTVSYDTEAKQLNF